ncbi:MAG: hypothetical protein ABR505_12475 [Actinomycetota bacterium]
MRKVFVVLMLAALLAALVLPVPAHGALSSTFALAGEARALEVAIGQTGVSLGAAMARADSTPSASGVAAGLCELLGTQANPDSLPCNEQTKIATAYPGPSELLQACAGPALPAPLSTLIKLELACGSSQSGLTNGLPFTTNEGKVADLAVKLDLTGLVPAVEDVKETVIDQLQDILDIVPVEPVKNAVNNLLEVLDEGQAGRIQLGPATSNVTSPDANTLQVESTAAGARIGLLGIPDLNGQGLPIPGTADSLQDGIIIIDIASSKASASINTATAVADAAASPSLIKVRVRDITSLTPSYVELDVAPGQSVTILQGTPLESTISAASSTTDIQEHSASSAADAVGLHLLKGVNGGIKLSLARTTAAANVAALRQPAPPAPQGPVAAPPKLKPPLPVTGGTDYTLPAIMLLASAGALYVLRRRFASVGR